MYALAHTLNDPRGAPRGLAGARPGPIQDLPGPLPGLSRGTPTPTRFHPHYLVPKLLFGNLPPRNSVSRLARRSERETEFRERGCPNRVWARGEFREGAYPNRVRAQDGVGVVSFEFGNQAGTRSTPVCHSI